MHLCLSLTQNYEWWVPSDNTTEHSSTDCINQNSHNSQDLSYLFLRHCKLRVVIRYEKLNIELNYG